ncbi:MAG TPA: SDR family NAD(P)-dependent oxidoreductase, partial [Pseudonocardiaceae bacterium]|nr:SDR family NAD(P)-dependent oxidoreductase [Pseudonocardiaceae bacterium]
ARRGTEPTLEDQDSPLGTGTVLVTGGTGGLGALVAEHVVARHGVRHLVLVSRRGPLAPGAAELADRLAEQGASVTLAACDVADRDSLAAVIAAIPAQAPLTAVVHSAGVLDDATLEGLTAQALDKVFAPKADAGWHLHELTAELDLSAFVVFSSLAGVLGNPGQGNYAASNTFVDALVEHRRTLGLPAVSIAWGLWDNADSSMAGHLSAGDVARLARSGVGPLHPAEGLDLFDAALPSPHPLVVAAKWEPAGLRTRAEADQLPPIMRGLVRAPRRAAAATAGGPAPAAQGGTATGLAARLAGLTKPDARQLLTDLVRTHVASVLAYDSIDQVDEDRAFKELGFDSLSAVELRNRLNAETGLRLPATLVFDHPTVAALAEHLFRTFAPAAPSPADTLRAAVESAEAALEAGEFDGEEPGDIDTVRAQLIAVLQSSLSRLGAGQDGDGGAAEQIDSASDEEIFALIDKEL